MKKIIILSIFIFITLCSGHVFAGMPAGIALYLRSGNETYLLLADHSFNSQQKRGWAGFGGAADKGETPAQTAARETEEETRGYFKKEFLIDRLKGKEPLIDDGFVLFFVEINFVPAQRIGNNSELDADFSYYERGPYAWIPFSDIQKHLKERIQKNKTYNVDIDYLPPDCHSRHYWSAWLGNIKAALDRGKLPWLKE